jgi:hypothetical protein
MIKTEREECLLTTLDIPLQHVPVDRIVKYIFLTVSFFRRTK